MTRTKLFVGQKDSSPLTAADSPRTNGIAHNEDPPEGSFRADLAPESADEALQICEYLSYWYLAQSPLRVDQRLLFEQLKRDVGERVRPHDVPAVHPVALVPPQAAPDVSVQITYEAGLAHNGSLLERIYDIPNAHVILWYIGPNGLKEEGVNFYKPITRGVLQCPHQDAHLWLMDLTGWASFGNPELAITKESSKVAQIRKMRVNRLGCIRSADILQAMQATTDPETVACFREILQQEFILRISAGRPPVRRTLGEVFENNCPILQDHYHRDSAHSYSLVQYVEGYFLIKRLILEQIDRADDINIVFAVPNNEPRYYRDDNDSFLHDIRRLLSIELGDRLQDRKVHIYFLSFKFGEGGDARPYLAGKKLVKKLTLDHLV